jgi:hypothetical protein
VAATVAVAGLAAWPEGAAGRRLLLAVGMLAVLLQGMAVVRAAFLWAAASAVVLLVEYAVVVVVTPAAHGPVAVAFGSGLLLAAELAAWSVELARTGPEPAPLVWRRVGTLAALILGSAAFSAALVISVAQVAQFEGRSGFLLRAVGVAAAVAVVAMLAWLSTRSNSDQPTGSGTGGQHPSGPLAAPGRQRP